MSVTFSLEALPTGTFHAMCDEVPIVTGVTSYEAALEAVTAHQATCAECAMYRPFVRADVDVDEDRFSVNVSNVNARDLLFALDLPHDEDLSGHEDGAAFLARVLVALGTERDDAALPERQGRDLPGMPFSGPWTIDCARPAGYITTRLEELHAVALEAARLGRSVGWS